jgi:hypothetical protein
MVAFFINLFLYLVKDGLYKKGKEPFIQALNFNRDLRKKQSENKSWYEKNNPCFIVVMFPRSYAGKQFNH